MNHILEMLRNERRSPKPRRLIVHDRSDRRHFFKHWQLRGDVLVRPSTDDFAEFWLPVANINHITLTKGTD